METSLSVNSSFLLAALVPEFSPSFRALDGSAFYGYNSNMRFHTWYGENEAYRGPAVGPHTSKLGFTPGMRYPAGGGAMFWDWRRGECYEQLCLRPDPDGAPHATACV